MNQLQEIQQLGETLKRKREEQAELTEALNRKNTEIKTLEEETLPALMDEIGISGIDLAGGGRVEVKDFIQANVSKANEHEAFEWLRATNNDGIIKNQIVASLDRGQDELAKDVAERLAELGVRFDQKQSIHHLTLKSFITEVLNNPELRDSLPREAFSVHEGRKVVFK